MVMKNNISIKNKKAYFNYEFIDTFVAGLCLVGTEIKSIREGRLSFTDSYCYFIENELFLKNVHIDIYENGTYYNHEPKRDRKLLLNKRELKKLKDKISQGGLTIVPTKIFINNSGLCKVEIALARGKKQHDKRNSIKDRDTQRESDRKLKL